MAINVFQECRQLVSAEDAAYRYGVTFDRKGWAICPFHNDHHASMSFKNGRFRCWSCGTAGDSIRFVGQLLGLEPLAAVERLNADFSLNLPLHRKLSREDAQVARRHMELVAEHKRFEDWRENFITRLCAAYRVAHLASKCVNGWGELTEREILAIKMQARCEYIADTLAYGTPEEQAQIYRESEDIEKWIQRILQD